MMAQVHYFTWGLQKWPCSDSTIPSSFNCYYFLKGKFSLINLETLRTERMLDLLLYSPAFRIINWFPSIFQKQAVSFFFFNELIDFNTFDLFDSTTVVILINVQIIPTLAGERFSVMAPETFEYTTRLL